MPRLSRRAFITGAGAAALSGGPIASAVAQPFGELFRPFGQPPPFGQPQQAPPPVRQPRFAPPGGDDGVYSEMYAGIRGEPFPVEAIDLRRISPAYLRKVVAATSSEPPGTIVVDPARRYLYLIEGGDRAIRYGVGRDLMDTVQQLRGGLGVPGGPGNPLGARAMYLWQNNKDTLFRIHGTPEPWTIGQNVSSGCIRMINQDAIDLYQRVPVGTKVVVLGVGARTV
jgi:lipoprotein-anchoring transpeptidase ErfK/SrfK